MQTGKMLTVSIQCSNQHLKIMHSLISSLSCRITIRQNEHNGKVANRLEFMCPGAKITQTLDTNILVYITASAGFYYSIVLYISFYFRDGERNI